MFKKYLSLVKFSHTIFALPFALIGAIYGIVKLGEIVWLDFALMLLCMVTARNSAMAFNRYIDRKFDSLNPRTATREIPAGIISPKSALIFIVINVVVFVVATALLNPLALSLSPVALAVACGYSLTKRFTSLCHVVLGLALAIAPVGAYIAICGEVSNFTILLAMLVLFWVSGFDVLYALSDEEFDRSNSLHSIPQFFGRKGALVVSALLHLCAIVVVVYIGLTYLNSTLYAIGSTIFALILTYEHIVVKPNDISRVNMAFATMNATGSVIYALFTIMAIIFMN